ncbi:acyltransferase family protein [Sphingomonas oleivorans]|uniref:acyltransferase family protein n=1 Tax=Sphingomonas oleivorans TaxID=1735121 RepID=UPI0013FE45D0|nr:acyltransferase [Sphingomonas oleivorans]
MTALRGVAALGVVLFHIDVCLFYREMGTLLPKTASGLIANGYLWVDLFFILSGYVIHHAYGERLSPGCRWSSAADFYRARFLRIYPLHLILTALLVVAVLIAGALWPALKDGSWVIFFAWSALPSNLLLTHALNQHSYLSWNIVSWSIGAEWWCYAAALIVIPLMARFRRRSGGICIGLGAAVLAGLFFVLGRDTLDITYDFGVVRCLGGFLIGLGLYQVCRVGRPLQARAADGLTLAAVAGLVLIMHFDASDLLAIPLFAILVMSLSASGGRVHRLLAAPVPRYLGRISYSIYLVHGLVFLAFWYAAPALGWRFGTPAEAWLFAAAFLVLTISGAAISYRFIELPAQRLARTAPLAEDVNAGEITVARACLKAAPFRAKGEEPRL